MPKHGVSTDNEEIRKRIIEAVKKCWMNNLAARWQKFNILDQMGNIGGEISRAFSWRQKGNAPYSRLAAERALELFDLTINDPRWVKRLKEITRSREIFCDLFFGKNEYDVSAESLMKYFDEFALAARKDK